LGKAFNAGPVIARLMEHFQAKENQELAAILGVSKQAVSNWKTRNTLDFPLVLEKFDGDLNWLFKGTPLEGAKTPQEALAKIRDIARQAGKTPRKRKRGK
jgi:hypothetical protein